MIRLPEAMTAWESSAFEETLKCELVKLGSAALPLQAAMSRGSHVVDVPPRVIIKHISDDGPVIRIQAGIFFKSIIAGCSCADDPSPPDEMDEYCELQLEIDKLTAVVDLTLLE